MIDTREELILALNEAAELEHALLVQYLFTAFTLKQNSSEGLSELQLAKVLDWKRQILMVAREEMLHFGAVCNLLSAIGAGPRMLRSNLPKRTDYFYSLDAPFTLTKFNADTIKRFVIFELPINANKNESFKIMEFAPDPIEYNKIGELYSQILNAFKTIPDIIIGDPNQQDKTGWGIGKRDFDVLQPIKTIDDVEETIKHIVEEGEGATNQNIENSHYAKFLQIAKEIENIQFEPSRNVVENPFTRIQKDSDSEYPINLITNPDTLQACELFNALYNSMLIAMMQYYSHSGETQDEKDLLRNISWQAMSGILRPLGEILTTLNAFNNSEILKAGPSFEIYGDYSIAPSKKNRFRTLLERWIEHSNEITKIKLLDKRLNTLVDKIQWMTNKISDFNNSNSYWVPKSK